MAWGRTVAGLSIWAILWLRTVRLCTLWIIVDLVARVGLQDTSTTITLTWKISSSLLLTFANATQGRDSMCLDTAWEVFSRHTLQQNMAICSLACFSLIHGYKIPQRFLC